MSDEYEIERKRFWRFIVDAYLNLDDDLIKKEVFDDIKSRCRGFY
jgi:hypothetical protein